MMKYAAVFLISFCVSCMGWLYSKKLELRVRKLEKILLFLSAVKTEIQFTADNIETILRSVSECGNFTQLQFISECVNALRNGEDFQSAWNTAVTKRENTYSLKKEDTALLMSFGSSLGRTDSAGQMRNCEMHERLFKEKLESALEDKRTLSKPAKGVGMLTGAAVVIIFL